MGVGAEGGAAAAEAARGDGASPAPADEPGVRTGRKGRTEGVTGMYSDVREVYRVEPKELGHGHYGVVRRCQHRETGAWFACKTIKKAKVSRLERLKTEIELLKAVDHPNIIKLHAVFEDARYIHLITELCTGGELFDRIIAKTSSSEGHYSEGDAALIVRKILGAIDYIHTVHNIVHRDLKPENFLFLTPDDDAEIKIIDFGLSRYDDPDHLSTRVGTPYYIAPEVLGRDYTKACDVWSLGVIMYILLCGFPPFYGQTDAEIFSMVRAGVFDFPSPEWDQVSEEAKDLIRKMLSLTATERPTASEALRHPWFQRFAGPDNTLISHTLRASLGRFIGLNKLKKCALHVISQQLTEREIGSLREVFEKLDQNGDGSISVEELQAAMESEGFMPVRDEIAKLMEGLDVDGNQSIEYEEFVAATMEVNTWIREENIRAAFQHFDTEGRGVLTVRDLVGIMGSEPHAREVMGEIDLDGDGTISYDEFRTMMRSFTS